LPPGQIIDRVCDNVHDFTVMVPHDGRTVTRIAARADRFPRTTCPTGRLRSFEGVAIDACVNPTLGATSAHIC
jgi:hypothetical protein